MRTYAFFYKLQAHRFNITTMQLENCPLYYTEIFGSDGIFILDGRNNINSHITAINERIEKMKKVRQIDGFKIFKGATLARDATVVYSSF